MIEYESSETEEIAKFEAEEKNKYWNNNTRTNEYTVIKHKVFGQKSIKQLIIVKNFTIVGTTYEVTYYMDGKPQVNRPFRKYYKTLKGAEKKFNQEENFIIK